MFSTRYAPQKRQLIIPDCSVKRLIVGDKQRCLECKVYVIQIGKNSKLSNLQPKNRPYKHAAHCSQRGRF